jgi:hypothetical protein
MDFSNEIFLHRCNNGKVVAFDNATICYDCNIGKQRVKLNKRPLTYKGNNL